MKDTAAAAAAHLHSSRSNLTPDERSGKKVKMVPGSSETDPNLPTTLDSALDLATNSTLPINPSDLIDGGFTVHGIPVEDMQPLLETGSWGLVTFQSRRMEGFDLVPGRLFISR